MIDARGIPTCECPNCGEGLFRALVSFDPETYMVGMYHFMHVVLLLPPQHH
jgi:uncharacterized protein (DUF983 family)